jgi:hypothetical protein
MEVSQLLPLFLMQEKKRAYDWSFSFGTRVDLSQAVAMGAANQFRAMGSAIGLAIVTSVFNDYVGSQLLRLRINVPLSVIATHKASVSLAAQTELRGILSTGYNRQMLTLCAFGAAQVPAALLMWKRKQVVVAK